MVFNKSPKPGCGFIYILSNESMFGIYKVGLTTNSVAQRIKELNSTGVPTSFRPEKIFEIKEIYLRSVEQAIHKELKNNDFHHGKEFFKVDLTRCIQCVEDVIHKVTGETSEDIVGIAKKRKEDSDRKREWERSELKRREDILKNENESIRQKRFNWINNQVDKNHDNYQLVKSMTIIGFIVTSLAVMVIYESFLPGLIVGLVGWLWIYLKNDSYEKSSKYRNESEASKLFPYMSLDDIPSNSYFDDNTSTKNFDRKTNLNRDEIKEKSDRAVHGRSEYSQEKNISKIKEKSDRAVHGRSESPPELTDNEFLSLIKFKKPPETKTWYLSKEGVGHKKTGVFIPMVSLTITDDPAGFDVSKLNIKIEGEFIKFIPSNLVEKPKRFGGDDLVSCPECSQAIRIDLSTNSKVHCPMCKLSWTQKI